MKGATTPVTPLGRTGARGALASCRGFLSSVVLALLLACGYPPLAEAQSVRQPGVNAPPCTASAIIPQRGGLGGAFDHLLWNVCTARRVDPTLKHHLGGGPPPAVRCKCAGMAGDPHVGTFDGARYDLQAAGEFVGIESPDDDLEVQYRLEPPGLRTDVSVVTAVAARVGEHRVVFSAHDESPVRIDGDPVTISGEEVRSLSDDSTAILIRERDRYTVVWPDGSNLHAEFRGGHLDPYFLPAEARDGRLTGLFGDADGDPENDFRTRDGEVLPSPPDFEPLYQRFAESWRVRPEESLFDYAPGESTETFTDRSIPTAEATVANLSPADRTRAEAVCREAGVTDGPLLRDCILDYGYTGDESFVASAASQQPPPELAALQAPPYSRTDGRVLLEEDFDDAPVGGMPSSLELIRRGWEVAELQGQRLLRHTGNRNDAFRVALPERLPRRFAVEFDVLFTRETARLFLLSTEPEDENLWGTPRYPHHQIWLRTEGSGILRFGDRGQQDWLASAPAPRLAEGLVHVRLEVDGSRAELHMDGELIAESSQADLPRSDLLWFQGDNVWEEYPLYVDNLRVVARQ